MLSSLLLQAYYSIISLRILLNFQQTEKKMKKYLKILRQCPLFYDIEDNELLGMLGCLDAKVETFDKKYTVFAEGKPASFIGILL